MFRSLLCLSSRLLMSTLIACVALAMTAANACAENKGQEDLDKATELKLSLESPRDLETLNKVVDHLDLAIEAGLDAENTEFAESMLVATLMQRATAMSAAVLNRPVADPRRDPRWIQVRQIALTDLQRATSLDDSLVDAHLLIGRLQTLPYGDPSAARRAMSQVIRIGKETPDAVKPKELAQAYALRGATQSDGQRQEADYTEALKLMPNKAEYLMLRSGNLTKQKKYDAALADIQAALKIDPDSPKIYEQQGLVLRAQEKMEEAIAAFDKATQLDPKSVTPYQQRAEIYRGQDELEKAIDQLNQALALTPDDLRTLLLRVELYSLTQQYEEALADLESVLKRQPGFLEAHLMRTRLLMQLDRDDQALAVLEKLAEAAPQKAEVHFQLAAFYMDADKTNKAIDSLSTVLKLTGDNEMALRLRGDLYLSVGKHDEALGDFAKSYELNPDDTALLNNYAWTLATSPFDHLRDGARAIELATKACELTDHKKPHILSTLAAAYAESGDFEKAIEWSQKAVDMNAAHSEGDATEDSGAGGDATETDGAEEGDAEMRDIADELAAELESYKAGEPWRELQGEEEPDPLADEPPPLESSEPARTLDF